MNIYPDLDIINRSFVLGDNQHIMKQLIDKGYSGKFDMIYLDGPFNSGLIFSMHNDQGIEFVHPWDEAKSIRDHFQPNLYLEDYKIRMELAKELLSDTGLIVLQTNQIMGHYVKIKLDEVFGKAHCLMEVIWKHSQTPWTFGIDQFGYQHETLFFYSKTSNYSKKKDIVYPSVWDDVGGYDLGEENTYFPSQKPEALLKRVIKATTQEGDLVGDFYSGSGTIPYVAEKLNRRWFACDNHAYSLKTMEKRFSKRNITIHVHSLVERFNPNYLNGTTYTKKTAIPFSMYELETLKEFAGDQVTNIYAQSYLSDIDLQVNGHITFNLLMPSMGDSISEENLGTISRPILIETKDGYSLKIENPLEWILYHVVHVERNKFNMIHINEKTNSYKKERETLISQAKEIENQINSKWIQSIEHVGNFVRIIDVFGYSYMLNKVRNSQ
ncbi:DNA-methyltransferase [Metabacillus bambusae]|uniref:Site-specific DNA-methyltransferase n=1 Tax=Metabacillus bambusae TaxID=2795218 RepID=A0ABS3N6S6_9BACI|nr:site-specific DNA-methyltransferase [Metabacillus bambusae]MBO1513934.1 site-specific DNA-methyltransferase [Metabacillus bambusae]